MPRILAILLGLSLGSNALGQYVESSSAPIIWTQSAQPISVGVSTVNSGEVITGGYVAPTISTPTVVTAAYSVSPGSMSPSTAPNSRLQRLEQLLTEASQNLDKKFLPNIETTRAEVEKAIEQLESFIVVGSENGKKWSSFLRLPEIKEQVKAKKPAYMKLLDLETNMRQNYLGLEYPQFTKLRDSLLKFAYAARFNTQEDQFIKFMSDALKHVIDDAKKTGSVDRDISNQLVTVVSNLHQSNQALPQLQSIRGLYSSQNMRVLVDESLVKRLAARPVSQPQNVNECILGTRVLGNAFMNGDVNLDLLPMNNGIGLRLDLNACMTSQTKGYNRGVVLNTVSSSPVWASKSVYISESGINSPPAMISTNLQSTIQTIEHRSRIVRRIAKRKAAEQKPQADAIAEDRLKTRICNEFTQQVDEQVSQAQPKLAQVRYTQFPELRRIAITKPDLNLSSSDLAIHAQAKHAEQFQLAADSDCPLPRPTNVSVVAQLHESAVGNALASVLAGRTIRNTSLGDYVKQITGKIPEDLKDEIEGEEWSVTLNPSQPVRIEFIDSNLLVTVRLIRMTRGKQSLNEALSITAKYYPQIQDSRLILTRQGEVTVVSDKNTTGTGPTALRAFIKNKFDKTLRKSIVTEPIVLSRLVSRFPKSVNLNLDINRAAIALDKGWLQVAMPL